MDPFGGFENLGLAPAPRRLARGRGHKTKGRSACAAGLERVAAGRGVPVAAQRVLQELEGEADGQVADRRQVAREHPGGEVLLVAARDCEGPGGGRLVRVAVTEGELDAVVRGARPRLGVTTGVRDTEAGVGERLLGVRVET